MPTRILIRLFLLAGLAAPLYAFALGVGQLEVRSSLNQTFEAEIPLISSNPVELIGLAAQIPRQQDFDRAGVERLEFLSKLRFSVQTPPGGPNVIKVSSVEPVREPSFNLLLELVWPRGRLIREFSVQLDPELYANRRPPSLPPPPAVALPPVAVATPVKAPPAAPVLPPAPPVSFEGATFYGPIKPGETLAAIARKIPSSATISTPQMMAILVAGNPDAFVNGNPSTLRANAVLKVPTPQALGVTTGTPQPPVLATTPVPMPTAPVLAEPAPSTPVEPVASLPSPVAAPATPMPATPTLAESPPPVALPPAAPTAAPSIPSASGIGSTPPQPLSPVEQPQEIIPQASIPQPTTPPGVSAPAEATPPPTVSAPPEATPPPPPVVSPPVVVKPPPVVETEISWMDNPVVWIAIGLIVLAVGAVLMLPLLRRPARPQPAAGSESAITREPVSRAEAPMSRTQSREPQPPKDSTTVGLRKAEVSAKAAQPVTRFLSKDGDAAKPMAAPTPKPIGELLKDMDSETDSDDTVIAGGKGAPKPAIKTPQFEAEPPTASITRRPSPFTSPSPSVTPPKPTASAPSPMEELPSELRMEGLDFDFGDFGIEKTVRPQEELPALQLSSLKPTPPSPAPSAIQPLAKPAMPDMKFEFTDISQEYDKPGADEPLRLDAGLDSLGDDDTMQLGKMELEPGGRMETSSDYVETKLDLATAYMDMGDQVGARNLLNEVIQDGDAAQKQRAGELLKKVS